MRSAHSAVGLIILLNPRTPGLAHLQELLIALSPCAGESNRAGQSSCSEASCFIRKWTCGLSLSYCTDKEPGMGVSFTTLLPRGENKQASQASTNSYFHFSFRMKSSLCKEEIWNLANLQCVRENKQRAE